jgi:phosphopantetheinyl transferase
MALYRELNTADYLLAVWRMDETVETLCEDISFPAGMIDEVSRFKSPHRMLEWLSARALLYTMTGRHIPIHYHPSGKPFIDNGYVSISHTKGYVAVAYSATVAVAVDIERFSERVRKVASRFMHPMEVASPYNGSDIGGLLLHWSGKETVYKMVGHSAVDFRENIHIRPFMTRRRGDFIADVTVETGEWKPLPVSYQIEPDYVLTWCVGQL